MNDSTTRTRHCSLCSYGYGDHLPSCPRSIQNRFWPQVHKTDDPGDCWEWTGLQDGHGYGHIYYLGRMQKAHRVAYHMTYGAILPSTMICHNCDNPACVRPEHLFMGNHTTNAQDMASKGRQVFQRRPERATRGEQHYSAKLTAESVRSIRQRHEQGEHLQALADCYQVSKQSVWRIVHRSTWKHVD